MPPPKAPSKDEPAEPNADDTTSITAATLLRGHLLQLLPCESRAPGEIEFVAITARDGTLLSLNPLGHTVSAATERCVLSRIAWWRFPARDAERTEVRFTIEFPLLPPSLGEHVVVAAPGGGAVDLSAATWELRHLRPKVLGCMRRRRDESLMFLLWLRLGAWGRLVDFGVEADTGNPSRGEQGQEHSCLRRALRLGRFPNPTGGEVTLRFPFVR